MFSPSSFWYLSLIFFYKFNNLWPGSIFLSLGNSFWKESRSEEKGNESAAKIWPDRRLLANPLTVLFWPFLILCFSSRAQLNAVLTKSSWKSEDGLLYSFSLAMTTEYKKHLLVYNIRQITGQDDVIDRINNQPYIKNNQNLIASFFRRTLMKMSKTDSWTVHWIVHLLVISLFLVFRLPLGLRPDLPK